MRGLYILAVLLVAAQLSACGDWHNLPNIKNRNSLANRVGNYGPARLDSDESARQASGRITPLKWKDDAKLDDREVLAAQKSNLKDVHVTCTAIVRKILPDDRVTSPHERFLLELSNGSTVLVAHNISLAPYIPLHEGDRVTVSGEFICNDKGGVIHYTHHATNTKHEGGWIRFHGETYK